ncbi:DUF362 domain-containing protein [candidate division KSB1 bacterium]|nr:DUF362 domain-containing protein [candidate division KSB1 bacterium]RQW06834.1 MAG: DUF362 domain-containing protein [candidate division KSB1 bacterium]
MKSVVSVLKSKPESVLDDIKTALITAGIESVLDKQKTTILKDNISWHFPYLSANTTPWQLEGVIRALKDLGFSNISAVHNNTVVTNARKGQRLNKLVPIYKKYGVQEYMNFDPRDIEWITFTPKAKMLVLDKIFPKGIKIPAYFADKNIIHLPTMKTHIYTTTTGAMKNAFGGLLNKKRHYTHSVIHETLVDLLAIQKEIHAGLFALMDGTISGSGPGPRTMVPHDTSLLLASADQVAIDAVAARIMGFDPMSIPYIRTAAERTLGIGEIQNMTIIGQDISSLNLKYTVGDNVASRFGDLLWFGPLKLLQKLFFHTPLVLLFVLGSFLYHDFLWWPLIGKRRQRNFQAHSEWGRFFQKYSSM